jgi:PAS domain S-box-containing protein
MINNFHLNKRKVLTFINVLALFLSIFFFCQWFFPSHGKALFSFSQSGMNPMTAIGLIAVGVLNILSILNKKRGFAILSVLVVIIAGLRILDISEIIHFSPDLLFFNDQVLASLVPSRMSLFTAVALFLFGVLFILKKKTSDWVTYAGQTIIGFIFFLAVANIANIFIDFGAKETLFFFSASLQTSIILCIHAVTLYLGSTDSAGKDLKPAQSRIINGTRLCIVLIGTLGILAFQHLIMQSINDNFDRKTQSITQDVQERFKIFISVLEGGRGLFSASSNVTRSEWKEYVDSLNLQENYPGIQGIGYSLFITPEEKENHEQQIRDEGFPNYAIRPTGERPLYSSIIYLEPFDVRNQQAFGYDMFSNQTRRSAMEKARDSGKPHVSGKITLVQEIDDDVQAGFLIYIPYYGRTSQPNSIHERRENILGFIYAPFRANDFINGFIEPEKFETLSFTLESHEGEGDTLIFKSPNNVIHSSDFNLSKENSITVGGETWTLRFQTNSFFGYEALHTFLPIILIIIFTFLAVFISLFLKTIFTARNKSKEHAEDLTQQLKQKVTLLEATLKEKTRLFNTFEKAFTYSPIGIALVSPQGKWLRVNQQVTTILGYSKEELLSIDFQKITHPDDLEADVSHVQSLLAGEEETYQMNKRYVHKQGHVIWAQLNVALVRSEGKPQFFISQIKDITAEKKFSDSKIDFVSLASHQIRTPLSTVNWYAELLLEDAKNLTKKQKSYLDELIKGGERMSNLVENLLNASRIELGTLKISREKTDVEKLLAESLDSHQHNLDEKNLSIINKQIGEPKNIETDPDHLKIVFDNLISNAIKYSKEASDITVTSAHFKSNISISVENNGIGIPKKEQLKIFEKTYRASNVSTESGFGLGLYVSKNIIERLGGTIDFISAKGKGAKFTITLPRKPIKK